MNTTTHYPIIDGTFTAAEASEVLLALFQSKIDYHSREKHSNHERFGKDPTHSEKRLQQLIDLQKALTQVLADAAESGKALKITGRIEVTPI